MHFIQPALLLLSTLLFTPILFGGDTPPAGIKDLSNPRAEGLNAFRKGAFADAAIIWKQAVEISSQAGDIQQQTDLAVLLAQAYKNLGHYSDAQRLLVSMVEPSRTQGLEPQRALLMAELGDIYAITGPREKAFGYFRQALQMAKEQKNSRLSSAVLNNMGNLLASEGKYPEAFDSYKNSLEKAQETKDQNLITQALVNAAMLAVRTGDLDAAKKPAGRAYATIDLLKDSHDTAFVLTNIGLIYHEISRGKEIVSSSSASERSIHALNRALYVAEKIGDEGAVSYSAGYLGQVHEHRADYQTALGLSRRAVFAAQKTNIPESLYLWQWQVGRLLRRSGDEPGALQSYRNSIATLQSIRQEMGACYGGTSLSFRQSVEPLYFEFVDLLLRDPSPSVQRPVYEARLLEARRAMESLKVAELRDYFQDDCVDAARSKVASLEAVSKVAVVIYPIVLPDRTELLVNLPSGLKRYSIPVSSATLTKEVAGFRRKLEKCTTLEFLPHARRLYTWLIRPIEKDIASANVDTLVFVPDGPLRTVPMGALHDGKEFLIGKYGIAITPGLDLTDPAPIKRAGAKVLMAGLTEGVQGYPPLPFVSLEMKEIQRLYNGTVLLNKAFSCSTFEKELKNQPFSMVHIASHGKFDRDVNKTFLLTFEDKLNMNNLNQYVGLFRFRQEPLELLTLSACETAAGDDRAALGLAGITIRAGARSAIATLWHVNDEASSLLVAEFYRQLAGPSVSRAAALRRAQLKLINDLSYDHPGYWSPFLLINNWL